MSKIKKSDIELDINDPRGEFNINSYYYSVFQFTYRKYERMNIGLILFNKKICLYDFIDIENSDLLKYTQSKQSKFENHIMLKELINSIKFELKEIIYKEHNMVFELYDYLTEPNLYINATCPEKYISSLPCTEVFGALLNNYVN